MAMSNFQATRAYVNALKNELEQTKARLLYIQSLASDVVSALDDYDLNHSVHKKVVKLSVAVSLGDQSDKDDEL